MKKILTLVLCIALLASMLSLVSCSDENTADTLAGKTPEELYEASQVQLREASSYTVVANQDIIMSVGDQSMTMKQLVESKINGDNSYVKTQNDFDSSLNMEAWYVDGTVYANAFGQKLKANITKAEYMEQYMNADPSESTLLDIPESWFENIKFEKDGEGWVLNFVVSGEKYTETFANVGMQGAVISGEVSHKVFFDADGNLVKVVTSFDMTVSGVSAHCDSISTVTIGEVAISAPADASTYQEVSLGN